MHRQTTTRTTRRFSRNRLSRGRGLRETSGWYVCFEFWVRIVSNSLPLSLLPLVDAPSTLPMLHDVPVNTLSNSSGDALLALLADVAMSNVTKLSPTANHVFESDRNAYGRPRYRMPPQRRQAAIH